MAKAAKYVYLFGNKKADGDGTMKPLLGGKGANLAEMSRIGLPVPPCFTITTEVCTYYYANKRTYPKALDPQAKAGVAFIEKIMGTKFGDKSAMPLLVSVRSGARDSMPGMMDTILNLGLNDQTVLALVSATQNERFAWDCYRRFIQMYGDVVMGVQKRPGEDHEPFETVIERLKHDRYQKDIEDTSLTVDDLKELVTRFKARRKQLYPLSHTVGEAILRYLKEVRPRATYREIFLSRRAPLQPLSGPGLWYIVSSRLRSLRVSVRHFGPHSLRHACATRLLSQGLSLKEVGDHLGHVDPDTTRIYAKVDLASLRTLALPWPGGIR